MKRSYGMFAAPVLTVLFLAGCRQAAFEPSPYQAGDLNQLPGVTMRTAEERYPAEVETIEVVIENGTEDELFYGVAFAVEYLDGEEWVMYPFEDEMAWIEIALILEPGGENREELDLTLLKHDLEPGTYRIIKEIMGEPLAAEFEIETE